MSHSEIRDVAYVWFCIFIPRFLCAGFGVLEVVRETKWNRGNNPDTKFLMERCSTILNGPFG